MRLTESVETSAGRVTVRELTVGEIRQWLAGLAARVIKAEADVVDELLIDDFSLSDLALFAGEVDTAPMTPSELRSVIDTARRLNADFFGLRARLLVAGTLAATSAPAAPSTPSSAPPSG